MKSSVAVIGDVDTVTGFQLGGIRESVIVNDKKEAEDALDKFINNEISIIIITEKIADDIREYIDKKIGSSILPMIIEIPDKSGSIKTDNDPMADLIKRVIGIDVVK